MELEDRLKLEKREPVELKLDGALGGVVNRAVQSEAVAIALAVLVEEKGLEGDWTIQITAAQLVPIVRAPAPQNGRG